MNSTNTQLRWTVYKLVSFGPVLPSGEKNKGRKKTQNLKSPVRNVECPPAKDTNVGQRSVL